MGDLVSLLPALEPVLGISFALNLAYVGLPRFRYRDEIRAALSKELDASFNGSEDQQRELGWYRTLSRLCGKTKTSSGKVIIFGELPDGVWSKLYLLFEKRIDRILSISACLLLGLLVFLGVGHSIGRFSSILDIDILHLFVDENIGKSLWLCFVLSFMPVVFVNSGKYTVKCAKSHSEKQIKDILDTMQANIQGANTPTLLESLPKVSA